MVNLSPLTGAMLDERLARINKARATNSKSPLNRNDIIEIAIENLTIEMGVAR
jgi:hypothetical protein